MGPKRDMKMQSGEEQAGSEMIHPALSYNLMKCAFKVHSVLGPGLPEAVYQRALAVDLVKQKIPFQSQPEIEVFYEDAFAARSSQTLWSRTRSSWN